MNIKIRAGYGKLALIFNNDNQFFKDKKLS